VGILFEVFPDGLPFPIVQFVRAAQEQSPGFGVCASAGDFESSFHDGRGEESEDMKLIGDDFRVWEMRADEVFEWVTEVYDGVFNILAAGDVMKA
jgi:hypothetical protein